MLQDSVEWHEGRDITYASYDDYFFNNYILHKSATYKVIKYIMSLYSNKYNLCSGYFPDFIPLDKNVFNDLYSDNDFPKYYPYIFNGKYLKQISNSESKYNNKYFLEMKTAYDISKQFWGKPSPSSGIGTKGSGIGTQGEQIWEVPNRRNPRNKKKCKFYYYDIVEEDIYLSRGGEVTTKNRFSLLEDTPCYGKKESLTRSDTKEDTPHKEVSPDLTEMQEWKDLFIINMMIFFQITFFYMIQQLIE